MVVTLATEDGQRVETEAIASFGGLAVTPLLIEFVDDEDELPPHDRYGYAIDDENEPLGWVDAKGNALYTVTHISSGCSLAVGKPALVAIRLMARFCELPVDWTLREEAIKQPWIGRKVREVLEGADSAG